MDRKLVNHWTPFIEDMLSNNSYLRYLGYLYNDKNIKVYPEMADVFKAFKTTPYQNVKVVIIGQDPYHTPGIANGLAFSSKDLNVTPPSLQNIFKSIEHDLGIKNTNPDLTKWANQGVLLMNTSFTVEEGKPGSHAKDWVKFTNQAISKLNEHPNELIFLLWGKHAQNYEQMIARKHKILKTSHPSPFSASKGFLTCKHFSAVNELLAAQGQAPIDWGT